LREHTLQQRSLRPLQVLVLGAVLLDECVEISEEFTDSVLFFHTRNYEFEISDWVKMQMFNSRTLNIVQ